MAAHDWLKKSVLIATASGLGAFTLCAPVAYGFFPPVIPDQGKVSVFKPPVVPPPPAVIPPVSPPVVPPVPPPCIHPKNPPVTPQGVPEPGTLVMAGLGIAAAAGAKWRKKKTAE